MVQTPPYWRASSLLFPRWDIKTKRLQPVKLDWPLFLSPTAGIIMSLPSSMADFVPCDRLLQKAYSDLMYNIHACSWGDPFSGVDSTVYEYQWLSVLWSSLNLSSKVIRVTSDFKEHCFLVKLDALLRVPRQLLY